jgi:glyoxylase-like metal-dependent hydrolase (beta-lactamase superfamily II)
MRTSSFYHELPNGITCIDTGYLRPRHAACYLIEQGDRAAFVDTGTSYTAPRLLKLLRIRGITPESVAYVMPTHVHLDHAGGAGTLMRQLPNAKLVVHPRGARHMINPSKLITGAKAVYGDTTFHENFGELLAVPETRITVANDGLVLDLNGRPLLFLDTPGHARHHYSIYDEVNKAFFTGDIFGLSYREFDTAAGAFIFPTTTPVQFDPDAWHASLDRLLLRYAPERMFLTHYGMVTDVERLARDLHRRIDGLIEIARNAARADDRHERIMRDMTDMLLHELAQTGCPLGADESVELFKPDLELNVQGLETWLDQNKTDLREQAALNQAGH